MAKKKIPEDVIKCICPGYFEEECIECVHMKEPVALMLKLGRKWGFITEEFLKKAINGDGEYITGCFVKGCEFRQKLVRRDQDGAAKYYLARYPSSRSLRPHVFQI